jgi:hypothetical protein
LELKINTQANIIGSLSDFNLIEYFLFREKTQESITPDHYTYTPIKTTRSVKRFETAITSCFLQFPNDDSRLLMKSVIKNESISNDSLLFLFWTISKNNDLVNYLNTNVFFPAFYSGRVIIKREEIDACITELGGIQPEVRAWTEETIINVARKYLNLMKKFNLMQGGLSKEILHPHLNDKMFVLFIYWLIKTEIKSNILNSEWLNYSFMERKTFIDRLLQKKFSKFYNVTYTGDNLKVEPIITYDNIYDVITKS